LTLPHDANSTSPTLTTQTASEMTDRDDDLRATIEHLRELLDGVGDVDPQARQLLVGALGEIRDKLGTDQTGDTQEQNDSDLDRSDSNLGRSDSNLGRSDSNLGRSDSGQQESVIERLTEAAKHFDDEHPTLAGMIGSVIDTLGRMGI
jgi:hypothetical protein